MIHITDINHKLSVVLALFVERAYEGGLDHARGAEIYADIVEHCQRADQAERKLAADGGTVSAGQYQNKSDSVLDPPARLLSNIAATIGLTSDQIRDHLRE